MSRQVLDMTNDKLEELFQKTNGNFEEVYQKSKDLEQKNASQDTEIASKANQGDYATLKARVDLLTKTPSGETEGNAELLDIRVGADGTTYPTAGDAVRSISDGFVNHVPFELISSGVNRQVSLEDLIINRSDRCEWEKTASYASVKITDDQITNGNPGFGMIFDFINPSNCFLYKNGRVKLHTEFEYENAGDTVMSISAYAYSDGVLEVLPGISQLVTRLDKGQTVLEISISDKILDSLAQLEGSYQLIYYFLPNALLLNAKYTIKNAYFITEKGLPNNCISTDKLRAGSVTPIKCDFFDNQYDLLNEDSAFEEGFLRNGVLQSSSDSGWKTSGYIEVSEYNTLSIFNNNFSGLFYAFYDELRRVISSVDASYNNVGIEIPDGAQYFRFSAQSSVVENILLVSNCDSYEDYNFYPGIADEYLKVDHVVDSFTNIESVKSSIPPSTNPEIGYAVNRPVEHYGRLKDIVLTSPYQNAGSEFKFGIFRYNQWTSKYECVESFSKLTGDSIYQLSTPSNPRKTIYRFNLLDDKIYVNPGDIIGILGKSIYFTGIASNSSLLPSANIYLDGDKYYIHNFRTDISISLQYSVLRITDTQDITDHVGIYPISTENLQDLVEPCYLYPKNPQDADYLVDTIEIYSPTKRTAGVAIGMVDQRGWFVASKTDSLSLEIGLNKLDVSSKNWIIPSGSVLAIGFTNIDKYSPTQYTKRKEFQYGKFTSLQTIETSDFEGTALFAYTLAEPTQALVKQLQTDITDVKTELSGLSLNEFFIYGPDGSKYRLSIDSSGNLVNIPVIPKKYLAIGNSILKHSANAELGWYSDWGMAATRQQYDYYHRIIAKLEELGSTSITADLLNYAGWERAEDRTTQLSSLDSKLLADLDLVTIQVGENVTDTTSFEEDLEELVSYIKEHSPKAYVVMIGMIFASTDKDEMKVECCNKLHIPFVDMSGYNSQGGFKSQMGEITYDAEGNPHPIIHAGVAGHPSDEGMRLIAQQTLRTILADTSVELE